jgi:hypothetical protein
METAIATVIAIVFGGLLNMAVAIWAEHRRRAWLTLSIEAPIERAYILLVLRLRHSRFGLFVFACRMLHAGVSNDGCDRPRYSAGGESRFIDL